LGSGPVQSEQNAGDSFGGKKEFWRVESISGFEATKDWEKIPSCGGGKEIATVTGS